MNTQQIKQLRFIGHYLTLSEFNPQFKIDRLQLIKIISTLPIIDSLFLLSRIDMTLNYRNFSQTPTIDIETQKELVHRFFSSPYSDDLLKWLSNDNSKAIFHSQQIYYCMGLILRYGKNERAPITELLAKQIGFILLYLNEHCSEENHIHVQPGEAQNNQLAGNFWQIAQFALTINKDIGTKLSRIFFIFNELPEGQIFSKKFQEITGVKLTTFWTIAFAIYTKWGNTSSEFLPNDVVLDTSSYFQNLKSLKNVDIETSFNLLSANLETLKKNHENYLDKFKHEPFNFEFLRESPLLEFEPNRYICLSFPSFFYRVTDGILEIIRTALKEKYAGALGNELGKVYETYMKYLLEQTYPTDALAQRVYDGKSKRIQIADSVIDYGNQAVFIETKALLIGKQYKISNHHDDIEKGLEEFLTKKGANQLDKRINEFRRGQTKISNIEPTRIEKYWPVLLTCTDRIPQTIILTDFYYRLLKKRYILQEPNMAPLTILDLEEFEYIMELVKKGHSFVDILNDKYSNQETYEMPIINYLAVNKEKYGVLSRPLYFNGIFEKFRNMINTELSLHENDVVE